MIFSLLLDSYYVPRPTEPASIQDPQSMGIRNHLIRIQHFRLNTNPDPDPDGFDEQKFQQQKLTSAKNYIKKKLQLTFP
jgi:hypothetical protein